MDIAVTDRLQRSAFRSLEAGDDKRFGEDFAFAVCRKVVRADFDRELPSFGLEKELDPRNVVVKCVGVGNLFATCTFTLTSSAVADSTMMVGTCFRLSSPRFEL